MIDEFFEGIVDRLCVSVPRHVRPRMVRFSGGHFGWRMMLYASAVSRRISGVFSGLRGFEQKMTDEARELDAPIDPKYAHLDPETARELTIWEREQREWEAGQEKRCEKMRPLPERMKRWWAGRHARGEARDKRWAQKEEAAEARAQKRMARVLPVMRALENSRFPFMMLLTVMATLGVCAVGGVMGYAAAACCLMLAATAFHIGYAPLCGGVRQRYLAEQLLRAGSFAALLPMYFGQYVRQGVAFNVLLQGAMIALLMVHALFDLALVAFNGRQPLLLRVLAGLLGVVPALTASAAIAYAATQLALPMPAPVVGVIGAAGALMAFYADRLLTITDLGGIRLRYTSLWVSLFMGLGYLLMVLGAWL